MYPLFLSQLSVLLLLLHHAPSFHPLNMPSSLPPTEPLQLPMPLPEKKITASREAFPDNPPPNSTLPNHSLSRYPDLSSQHVSLPARSEHLFLAVSPMIAGTLFCSLLYLQDLELCLLHSRCSVNSRINDRRTEQTNRPHNVNLDSLLTVSTHMWLVLPCFLEPLQSFRHPTVFSLGNLTYLHGFTYHPEVYVKA